MRTLELDVLAWSDSPLDPSADRERILRHPNVALYWFRIFASFAATGTHSLAPYQPSSPREVLHFEQIAWAQEFFAVAHEFAHHALGHRSVDADPVQQEFEADSLALYICEGLEFEPFQFLNNPYVRTGAAAILLLRALSILSRVERELGGAVGSAKTHPLVEHRIQKIAVRHALQPKQFRMDKNFNGTVERIMDVVETLVLEFLERGGTETLSSIRRRAKG